MTHRASREEVERGLEEIIRAQRRADEQFHQGVEVAIEDGSVEDEEWAPMNRETSM